jgi:hypothetical protein
MAVAWSSATGQDWVRKCDFAAHTPEYYLFHYRPWVWPPQVVHVGVKTTDFLVVLQATDQQSSGSTLSAERIERQGQVGAMVTVKDTVYEVTFVPAGQPGGHIRVQQSGRLILDRGLASGIEDNYRKWATDPRYKSGRHGLSTGTSWASKRRTDAVGNAACGSRAVTRSLPWISVRRWSTRSIGWYSLIGEAAAP